LSATDGIYVGSRIRFTSGALSGQSQVITAYTGSTRTFTLASGFSGIPATNDVFSIDGSGVVATGVSGHVNSTGKLDLANNVPNGTGKNETFTSLAMTIGAVGSADIQTGTGRLSLPNDPTTTSIGGTANAPPANLGSSNGFIRLDGGNRTLNIA